MRRINLFMLISLLIISTFLVAYEQPTREVKAEEASSTSDPTDDLYYFMSWLPAPTWGVIDIVHIEISQINSTHIRLSTRASQAIPLANEWQSFYWLLDTGVSAPVWWNLIDSNDLAVSYYIGVSWSASGPLWIQMNMYDDAGVHEIVHEDARDHPERYFSGDTCSIDIPLALIGNPTSIKCVAGSSDGVADPSGRHDRAPNTGHVALGFASTEVHLPVPFESQGNAMWCSVASTSMVLRYYGKNIHIWEIASDIRYQGYWTLWAAERYINWKYLSEFRTKTAWYEEVTDETRRDIESNLTQGYPIILGVETGGVGEGHAVVISGFNQTGFFINDPSGALFESLGKAPHTYNIHRYVCWEELKPKIFHGILRIAQRTLLAVQGTPHPVEATLWTRNGQWLHSEWSMIVTEHNSDFKLGAAIDYGLPLQGMSWRMIGLHPAQWDTKDTLFYQFIVFNHKDTNSIFDSAFRIKGVDGVTRYENFLSNIQAANYSSASIDGKCALNCLPLSGFYVASCDLYDHSTGTLIDSIKLPTIYYGKSLLLWLNSPADILITGPDGLRVGFDNVHKENINEIPGAYYSGNGSEPQFVSIPAPLHGIYIVDLHGTGTGSYMITVESIAEDGTVVDTETWTGTTSPEKHDVSSFVLARDGSVKGYPGFVIPDLPMGAIAALASALMALATYTALPRWRRKRRHYT